jgi:hypothetical protein
VEALTLKETKSKPRKRSNKQQKNKKRKRSQNNNTLNKLEWLTQTVRSVALKVQNYSKRFFNGFFQAFIKFSCNKILFYIYFGNFNLLTKIIIIIIN